MRKVDLGVVTKPRPVGAFNPVRPTSRWSARRNTTNAPACTCALTAASSTMPAASSRDQRRRSRQNLLRSSRFGGSHRRNTLDPLQVASWHTRPSVRRPRRCRCRATQCVPTVEHRPSTCRRPSCRSARCALARLIVLMLRRTAARQRASRSPYRVRRSAPHRRPPHRAGAAPMRCRRATSARTCRS